MSRIVGGVQRNDLEITMCIVSDRTIVGFETLCVKRTVNYACVLDNNQFLRFLKIIFSHVVFRKNKCCLRYFLLALDLTAHVSMVNEQDTSALKQYRCVCVYCTVYI